jgi:hypothetical protein
VPKQTKTKKVGRPKLPKGEARGKIVQVRFSAEEIKRLEAAAKASKQTVSEWLRSHVAIETTAEAAQ